MARLVVRNRDKVNVDDVYLDAQCLKRGMVVEILPDGKSLGTVGDKYEGWTVIEVPGVSVDDLSAFLAREPGDPLADRMLQRRAFKVDLDAWAQGGAKAALTVQECDALKAPVEKRADPNIFEAVGK